MPQEIAGFGFESPGDLKADPFAEEAVDVLDERRDLAHHEEWDAGVFQKAFGHGEMNAVVGFEHDDELRRRVGGWVRRIGVEHLDLVSGFSIALHRPTASWAERAPSRSQTANGAEGFLLMR